MYISKGELGIKRDKFIKDWGAFYKIFNFLYFFLMYVNSKD